MTSLVQLFPLVFSSRRHIFNGYVRARGWDVRTMTDDQWSKSRAAAGCLRGKPTNDASHAVKHGSEVRESEMGAYPKSSPTQAARFLDPTSRVLIIAALLTFATPAFAQQPASAIGDGWIAELREARQDLREHREAIKESAGESRRWRELFERDEPGPFSRFLDRIGNGLLLVCGTVAFVGLCFAPFGVAVLVREARRKT